VSNETEDQGSLCPVLTSSNAQHYFFPSSRSSVQDLAPKPECYDFHFNMNKRQGALFNFGGKKFCMRVFVMQQIVIHPSQAYRAISSMYKEGKNYQHKEERVCIHSQAHGQPFVVWFHTMP
jgi:hypothetical protein